MYQNDTELLFPSRVISTLGDLRGQRWRELVEMVMASEPTDLPQLAFVLMMVRIDGCNTCQADSYRAMRGCALCANQAVRRFRGSDEDLVEMYQQAYQEVETYLYGEAQVA